MGEIRRQDIIDDDAVLAPLVLQKNFESLLGTVKMVIAAGKEHSKAIGATTSTTKLKEETEKLSKEQIEFIKIQNQIATVVAKNNDAYREQEKELQRVKKELKDKNSLSDQEALAINKTNASIEKLGQALTKNRQAYAQLRTEQERNSKQGKELLKTIQQQDTDFKKLRVSMGQAQDNVGNYQSALAGLDGTMGGLITRTQGLGKALLAILSNPVVLAIAALVGLFVALKSAVTTYYDKTVEGEEKMKKQQATWDAFFITLKSGWADLGERVDDFFSDKLKGYFVGLLAYWDMTFGTGLVARFLATEQKAQTLADTLSRLWKEHIRDVVDDANTELRVNELLEKSKDKLRVSDEDRLKALRDANALLDEQLKGDIELARMDIKAQRERIAELGGVVHTGKMIKDLSDAEIIAMGVKQEEIEKLGQLEAALLKVQSDASAKRKGFLKQEAALAEEIRKDQVDKATIESEKGLKIAHAELNKRIGLIQQEVILAQKTKKEGDEEIIKLQKQFADDLVKAQIEGLRKLLLVEQLTAEERAEIEKKLTQLKIDLQTAYYEQVQSLPEVTIIPLENELKALNELKRIYSDFAGSIGDLLGSITERRLSELDREEAALSDFYNNQIKLAGDNEEAKKQLEHDFADAQDALEKKRIDEQRKLAVYEKAASAVQAAINTALAVTNQLAGGDPLTAFGRALAAGIAGGIQVAAILAKPLPQYEIGTSNHPGGLAIVGEGGSELYKTPSGQFALTPDRPTVMDLPRGTEVFTHDETLRMLAMRGLTESGRQETKGTSVKINLQPVVDAIKSQKLQVPDYARIGSDIYEVKKERDGSKSYIKSKSLSS